LYLIAKLSSLQYHFESGVVTLVDAIEHSDAVLVVKQNQGYIYAATASEVNS